jgi:UDP-3-O-[3-hydroxymyristoyl] glucosamine N-acyltransferase
MKDVIIFSDKEDISAEVADCLTDCSIKSKVVMVNPLDFGEIEKYDLGQQSVFVAISNQYLNYTRASWIQFLKIKKANLINVIHPSATIESDVSLGLNCFLSYSVSLKAKAKISHNVFIGKNTHVGVNVNISNNAWIGSDVIISSDSQIGFNVIIGNGSRIDASISDFCELSKPSHYSNDIKVIEHHIKESVNPIYYLK